LTKTINQKVQKNSYHLSLLDIVIHLLQNYVECYLLWQLLIMPYQNIYQ